MFQIMGRFISSLIEIENLEIVRHLIFIELMRSEDLVLRTRLLMVRFLCFVILDGLTDYFNCVASKVSEQEIVIFKRDSII